MELKKQVCSPIQAKILTDLGIDPISQLYHFQGGIHSEAWGSDYYPAFSVAELGVALQAYDRVGHSFYSSISNKWAHTWSTFNGIQPVIGWYDTEAVTRAAMLIHLLENNHITAAEVNQRLSQ